MNGWQFAAALAFLAAMLCLWPGADANRLGVTGSGSGGTLHSWGPPARAPESRSATLSSRVRLLGACAGALAVLVALPAPWSIPLGLVAGLVAHLVLGRIEPRAVRRRKEQLLLQQPEVLDLLTASLDAGAALRTATANIARIAPQPSAQLLQEVDAHLRVGFSEAQAWRSLGEESVWGDVARDLARSAETGEPVAKILRSRAQRARQRRHNHLTARARAVGVQAVGPMMVCFLPAFILVGVVPIIAATVSRFLS
ncbi:Type II secretion system (T2SS), protein F [Propionibacterium cyclohexanicum]|uniref:Type II secretion system (T2SS), protein F n=1 Tax=Propionibacterium cyclohexanicum TaxID=64702 RepID=A0A1H9TBP2_9ACTN|nr:type II secretion system F family protein [Propionibacterium cyclohexanicum]SER94730.1 Type II secretion system (T2SS), protein F [Propionibacterium cyclohexanicum]